MNKDIMINNLIKTIVKLETQLNHIHFVLEYNQEQFGKAPSLAQRADILNRIEGVLAHSEYLWEHRYEQE